MRFEATVRRWRTPAAVLVALLAFAAASCAGGPTAEVVRTGLDGATARGAAEAGPAAPALAPSGRGAVTVVVTAAGRPVPDTPVVLVDGGTPRTAVTDATGRSRFADLDPQTYRVWVLYLGDNRPVCDPGGACVAAVPASGEAREVTVSADTTTEAVFSFSRRPVSNKLGGFATDGLTPPEPHLGAGVRAGTGVSPGLTPAS